MAHQLRYGRQGVRMNDRIAITTYPMHGQHKLTDEGYRTRDGHMIEWFGRLLDEQGEVAVLSRPEPLPLALKNRLRSARTAPNTRPFDAISLRLPSLRDRRRWWVDSLNDYRGFVDEVTPVVTWNPFCALSNAWPHVVGAGQPIVVDLLDDWTLHFAFESVRSDVERAYARLFDTATTVTANAEGTLELARRYGRNDAVLIPNGCDPERFSTTSAARGPITVGYVGKIGRRLDLRLILDVARSFPALRFVFAGPILDGEYRAPLAGQANIELLGDVHYDEVPELLRTFDVGWVPHNVGTGEVGGDVIKTYEYRASGLVVLTTPVAGSGGRGLDAVNVVPAHEQVDWLHERVDGETRIPRVVTAIPEHLTWRAKATRLLDFCGLRATAGPNGDSA